jgi:putative transposase
MVTPDRRRRAVVVLRERFGVSERRACVVVGQPRSTQRKPRAPRRDEEQRLRAWLREFAREHPRLGWKTAHRVLAGEGRHHNRKRIRRLWRDEGLVRPQRCRKRRRVNRSSGERLRAVRPNQVWGIDFQFDETADGRRLKLFNVVDEHTREALAMRVGRTCDADQVIAVIEALVADRGAPVYLRCDNGPELIAWGLRDWCRLAGFGISYIEPGTPWENPFVESFNGRARDELLNIEEFGSVAEARVIIEAWRHEYNTWRPHGSLGGLTPADYAARWTQGDPTVRSTLSEPQP